MPYILSPEQKVVTDALQCKEASSTKYFDIISAIQSISKGCASVLGDGKKILIHVADERDKETLRSMFLENGLDDLTIDISESQSMPEVDIIKLRSTLKKQKNSDTIINYVLSNKKESTLKSQISDFYSAFDTKVMANIPFRDFAANSIYNKKQDIPLIMVNFDAESQLQFSASEYYNVKKELSNASQIFHRQYDLYDHLSFFNEELWKDIDAPRITEIKKQLNEFKVESTDLVNDFIKVTNKLLAASTKELNKTFEALDQMFMDHEEACISYHIKSATESDTNEGMFSIFKKKAQATNKIYTEAFDELSGMIQNISQEWYHDLDAPTTEMITYEYIIKFITDSREKSTQYRKALNKNLQKDVQRINKINTSSKEVISLDKRLTNLILRMKESQLFDLELEHNILSFLKQVELCKNIVDYIEKCNVLVHSSSSYLEWKSFYNSSGNVFRLIFNSVKKMPKKAWIECFENWYEHQVRNRTLSHRSISTNELDRFLNQAIISNEHEVSSVIANLHSQRIQGAELLKATSKDLYNTLFKKKQLPNLSWQNTALVNRDFMKSFFPIHLSDSMAYSGEYDLVISFSSKEESDNSKTHYFSPIESKDIQDLAEKRHNFLYLNVYNYNRPIDQLSSTDKLKASKKLAKYILSLNQNIKIYQLKNANIISLLPAHDDSFLERELDKINVKVIDTNGVMYNRLTESILMTDRKPYLIIKDELINCELHDHVLWQLKMIQLFKEVGYDVLSLNTTDQLTDNNGQFDKILQKIDGDTSVVLQKKPQNSDEVESIPEKV